MWFKPACFRMAWVVFLMGVSGCGKSTIGKLLSESSGLPFYDGDDYHPSHNIEKMSRGVPLNDEDRKPWLAILHQIAQRAEGGRGMYHCLFGFKKGYRQILADGIETKAKWYWLDGDRISVESKNEE
ncbi:MAG: gluconokinase [Saprospiraceae bacterium]|nr:gluconokinase [Saprospiraceae bacterium]